MRLRLLCGGLQPALCRLKPAPTQHLPKISERQQFPTSFIANVNDASPIDAAEFFVDTTGDLGTGNPATVAVNVISAPLPPLEPGTHTIYVRARDVYRNW